MREGARRSPGVAVVDRVGDLSARLDQARADGHSVGVVPTMGALHHGHLSLIRRASAECAVVVVTVFVNPLQFGPGEDLATYPCDIDADIEMVARGGGHIVFTPPVAEMYPSPEDASATCGTHIGGDTDFEGLTDVLEGASRPGHFGGVATVVARIFDVAGPCRAYFGEKDWQQVLVVRRLVEARSLPVQVVTCPTVRDIDGLACSSRNVRLSSEERVAALVLSDALAAVAALVRAGEHDPSVIRRHLIDAVTREPLVRLDYAAVVRADDLAPLHRLAGEVRLLLAARVGTTRLIDNVGVTSTPDVPRTTDVSVPRRRSA
ncbi:MAG: pantoate--beta-alanine ligase [Acidimicrobiales bacterium]